MKKRKLSAVIQWIFGLIFIVTGLGGFSAYAPFAVAALLFGISLLPPVWRPLQAHAFFGKKWVRRAVSVALFFLVMATASGMPQEETSYTGDKTRSASVEREAVSTSAGSDVEELSETAGESSAVQSEAAQAEEAAPEASSDLSAASETETPEYNMTVHFLDVGQGLSILVQSGGETLIYDGGDGEHSSFVVAYLKKQGVSTIDYLISSHYDSDHVSGLIGCLNAFEVKQIICSDYVHDSKTYTSFINTAEEEGLALQHPQVGEEFAFGTGKFVILAPETIEENESNDNSVAIKLINGDNSFIFTGDAESASEAAMCASGIDLDCDVLVPGHHGSATATSWEFLQASVPEFAVISCGADNSYGHPHKDTMDKLEAMEIPVYRTDIQGTIIAVSDGESIAWDMEPCNDYSPGDGSDGGTQAQGESKTKSAEASESAYTGSGSGDTAGSSGTEAEEEADEPESQNQEEMVWISATGEKYHKVPDCGRMNPDKATQITLSEAERRGYEPCKKCW